MKRVLGLLLILVMMLSLVACGGDDLIGTWELKNDSEEGMTGLYVFDEDTLTIDGLSADYTVKGSKLYIEFTKGQEEKWKYSIKDDLLTLTTGKDLVELKRVK